MACERWRRWRMLATILFATVPMAMERCLLEDGSVGSLIEENATARALMDGSRGRRDNDSLSDCRDRKTPSEGLRILTAWRMGERETATKRGIGTLMASR